MSEVLPRDVLLRVGGRTLARAGTLVAQTRPDVSLRETVTRSSVRRVLGRDRGRTVAAHIPAIQYVDLDGDGVRETPGLLLEQARTQVITDPENFGAWTANGTPVLTSGQADPFGGTAAYSIEDNDAAAVESIRHAASATDGTFSVFLRWLSGTVSTLVAWDGGAAATRHRVQVTWTGGVPTLSTIAGAGVLFPVERWGGGWYRLSFSATGVVTELYIYPNTPDTAATTNTIYIFGANAWAKKFPASYQGPSESSGAADSLSVPSNLGPIDCTVLARLARPACAEVTAVGPRILWQLGSGGVSIGTTLTPPNFQIFAENPVMSETNPVAAIPAGAELAVCSQFRNLLTVPAYKIDVGSGFGSDGVAGAFTAFTDQRLWLTSSGAELDGVLLDLIIARGLFTRAEMIAIP